MRTVELTAFENTEVGYPIKLCSLLVYRIYNNVQSNVMNVRLGDFPLMTEKGYFNIPHNTGRKKNISVYDKYTVHITLLVSLIFL